MLCCKWDIMDSFLQNYIQTRMWNMISSPASPTVCLKQKSESFQSLNVTLLMPSPSKKIIVFEIICNVAHYCASKFTFPIEQPSNEVTNCGLRRSWKLKVKPNLVCCSNIAITISYISVFMIFAFIDETLPLQLAPGTNLS